jgi:predicted PurR-regulated permease PerM
VVRGHWHREKAGGEAGDPDRSDYIEIDPSQLGTLISVPEWLRNAGLLSWLTLGIGLLLVAAVWLAAMTQVIVVPVIVAAIVAAVASPLLARMAKHGVPRALGSVLVLLLLIGLTVGMLLVVVLGITGQAGDVGGHLDDAKTTITGWTEDLGLDPEKAKEAGDTGASSITDAVSALLNGVITGIAELSSLAFFLAMMLLSLFFLLKDGPLIRGWVEGHLGVAEPVAKVIGHRVLGSLRGYFLGVTIVAAFNAVVVTIGALILGVPLVGTIAAVTFIGAYIPYLGAWAAGAFAVLIALGGSGPEAAAGMIVVQLLANGILQQLVQPFAMGTALGIHPLAVLIVTIAGGALFGTLGLILAAPLTAALTRITADLAQARARDAAAAAGTNPAAGAGAAQPAPGG